MIIASTGTIAKLTNEAVYKDAAKVTAAVVAVTGGKLPCYAIKGKRVPYKWVSVGSSCVIPRGEATKWLARFGADIDAVEAVGLFD